MKDNINLFSFRAKSLSYSLGIYWQNCLIDSVKQKEQLLSLILSIFLSFFLESLATSNFVWT